MKLHEVFPYLRVKDAPKAIAFYEQVFGVKEKFRLVEPSGRIGHSELDFHGITTIMVSEEYPEMGIVGPGSLDGTTGSRGESPWVGVSIHLHVDDCDALIAKAESAGAKVVRKPADHFYGERSGTIRDPFGHEWLIGHEIEKVDPKEMQRRYTEMMKA